MHWFGGYVVYWSDDAAEDGLVEIEPELESVR